MQTNRVATIIPLEREPKPAKPPKASKASKASKPRKRWYQKRWVWGTVLVPIALAYLGRSRTDPVPPAPPPPTVAPPNPAQVVAAESNTDLVQEANNLFAGVGHAAVGDRNAYADEILTRFTDRAAVPATHVLCVNDASLWGDPGRPKVIWAYVVGPRLNGWLAANGLQYPPPGTWDDPIPPRACS